MARISTAMQKKHGEALQSIADGGFNAYDVFESYHEGATNMNGLAGAFFTPYGLAKDFSIEVGTGRIIDLCAGIGVLAHACSVFNRDECEVTCIEQNPEYVAAGEAIVPWATWRCMSVTDLAPIPWDERYDHAISNPPFGNIAGFGMFDLEVVRIASTIAKSATFILPQMSTPFRYSGRTDGYKEEWSDTLKKWSDKNGISFEFNCGIDCNVYLDDWKGVKPVVEIVNFDFSS